MKKIARSLFIVIAVLMITNAAHAVDFPFGKKGKISYDLNKGTFSVFSGSLKVFDQGLAEVKVKEGSFSSASDVKRAYTKSVVKDQFGTGVKHVISLSKDGSPLVKQVFYTYPHQEYFLTALEVMGNQVTTNNLIPVAGRYLPTVKQHLTSLFVPFDNDAFISYEAKDVTADFRNTSAEVGTVYDNTQRVGIVMGAVEQDTWKTAVMTSALNEEVVMRVQCGFTAGDITRDQLAHGEVHGTNVKSAKIFFGYFTDWRRGMELYGKASRLADPPIVKPFTSATPVGWNSWGAMQERVSYEKALKVVDFFADSLRGFRSGNTCFVDLDSYWDNLLKGGLDGDYSALQAFADYCKKKGLKPGIYWAPFTDWNFKSGGSRKLEGTDFTYGEMWTKVGKGFHDFDGARALDPTHPGTKHRIKLVIERLKACGFEMIKIDFLGHAAAESSRFYDAKVTTGMQAYRVGMEYLIQQLDGKMLIYAAISPSVASGRYVHVRRIACDAFKSIKDTEYTLNSVTNGWWQSYLYDYIDADHVVLDRESDEVNISRVLSALVTGTLILGDDFSVDGPWKAKAMKLVQDADLLEVIKDGAAFVPVEGRNAKSASTMFVKRQGKSTYLAIFNYNDEPKEIKVPLLRIGLKTGKIYDARDLISKQNKHIADGEAVALLPHQSIMLKIKHL